MRKIFYGTILFFTILFLSCSSGSEPVQQEEEKKAENTYATVGSIERFDERINDLIPTDAKIEILAEGFEWSEGPVWVETHQMILFSDIPRNKIMKWSATEGLSTYLYPAGYTGAKDYSNESGSNGLILDQQGNLVLCQHGDRRVARMDAALDQPEPKFITIAETYNEKRFNSPNDLVMDRSGNIYFTDPPYGLPKQAEDPSKELSFQGVYFWSKDAGTVKLLTDEFSRPNGIALSPDEKTLYVANSDQSNLMWKAFDNNQGEISNGRIFFDGMALKKMGEGSADGLKVDSQGNVWATAPGGVAVFSPQGVHLGMIKTGQRTANCAFNADYSALYMTADMYLLRLKLQ